MGVMTTETRMAAAILLEKDVARVCAWLLKTPTLEWESHYHRHFDELHYYRLFYDDTLMSFITTDFFMTAAFPWLKKEGLDTWMRVLLPQTVWWASLLQTFVWQLHSMTRNTCMSLITTDPDTWRRVALPQTRWCQWASLLQTFVWQVHFRDPRHVHALDY